MKSFIRMHVLMGIINLSSYILYWYKALGYEPIALAMSKKLMKALERYLHVVGNTSYDQSYEDKLFKIRQLLEALRNGCVKPPKRTSIWMNKKSLQKLSFQNHTSIT